ncbi:dihydrofolate synthase/folylpolyglutamate synthase [Elusimicrobium simillimum]|uniref:bifunctional folylpolyglutamate synthase/dihydrofolate synthase n=1 Tax=Elusimicrobium simillimum TaxID=3143438 RepID=UPI003C702F66
MFNALHNKILKRHLTIKKEQNFNALNTALFALKNPHSKIKTIHITGTNGKGSTAATLALILQKAGYKVGLYTSPHIISPLERIQINGKNISARSMCAAVKKVLAAEDAALNYFEVLSAAAFYYFAKNKVDYAVIEAGLGGTMDATNVVTPAVSIITSVGLDHKDVLGGTLRKVAANKAGIIKPGVPCVCGKLPGAPKSVIETVAKKNKSKLVYAQPSNIKVSYKTLSTTFKYKNKNYTVSLLGEAQAFNAALAIEAAALLGEKSPSKLNVKIPARFEIIKHNGITLILDGAHNPDAIQNLRKNLSGYKDCAIVFAAMKDKDVKGMLGVLKKQKIYLTQLAAQRAATAADYGVAKTQIIPLKKVIKMALSGKLGKTVVFTGSFYLAAEVKKYL